MTGNLRCPTADLMSLLAAIAKSSIVTKSPIKKSPIVVATGAELTDGCFADWCASRQGADIDAEILAWIASHVGAERRAARALH
jgi:hypothetical protein